MNKKLGLIVLFSLLRLINGSVLGDQIHKGSDHLLAKQMSNLIKTSNYTSIGLYNTFNNFKSKDVSDEILNHLHPETWIMTDYHLKDYLFESKHDIVLYFVLKLNEVRFIAEF